MLLAIHLRTYLHKIVIHLTKLQDKITINNCELNNKTVISVDTEMVLTVMYN